MQFLEKLWKIREKIEILNLLQHKEEGIIQYQNQIIILQSFHSKLIINRNEKNRNTYE